MDIKKQKNVSGATLLRSLILFLGLIMAAFYGIKGEWAAALVGVAAAGIAFGIKGQNRKGGSSC